MSGKLSFTIRFRRSLHIRVTGAVLWRGSTWRSTRTTTPTATFRRAGDGSPEFGRGCFSTTPLLPFLTPFLVGRVPLIIKTDRKKKRYPCSNLSNLEDLVKSCDLFFQKRFPLGFKKTRKGILSLETRALGETNKGHGSETR